MAATDPITILDRAWEPGNQPQQPVRFAGEVRRLPLVQSAGLVPGLEATLALVQFVDGARTHWHSHAEDQHLVVVEGICHYGSETGQVGEARAGQIVHMPAGQRHWHGAAPGTTMTHVSITGSGGSAWFGPVT